MIMTLTFFLLVSNCVPASQQSLPQRPRNKNDWMNSEQLGPPRSPSFVYIECIYYDDKNRSVAGNLTQISYRYQIPLNPFPLR